MLLGISFAACVEDTGNYSYENPDVVAPIIKSGIDENYSVLVLENLVIDPTIEGDESQYDYVWYAFPGTVTSSAPNDTLGVSKKLDCTISMEPGTYQLVFKVTDKSNGTSAFYKSKLVVASFFSEGYYILKYENGYTEQMLDVLKKHNAKGCFFVTMTYIRDNPDIIKRMKEEGHQVGNHTVHHPCMPEKSVEEQKSELKECSDFMKSETGYDMDMYFRPPSGEYSEQVLQLAKDMGYKTIFWSMAYLDYDVNNQPGTDYVIDHFAKYYHPGAIPLIHNVSSSNAQALDTVLTNLEKEGYEFRSLNEMKFE